MSFTELLSQFTYTVVFLSLWIPVDVFMFVFMDECWCFNYICAYFRLFGCLGEQPRDCFQTSHSSSTSQAG